MMDYLLANAPELLDAVDAKGKSALWTSLMYSKKKTSYLLEKGCKIDASPELFSLSCRVRNF